MTKVVHIEGNGRRWERRPLRKFKGRFSGPLIHYKCIVYIQKVGHDKLIDFL